MPRSRHVSSTLRAAWGTWRNIDAIDLKPWQMSVALCHKHFAKSIAPQRTIMNQSQVKRIILVHLILPYCRLRRWVGTRCSAAPRFGAYALRAGCRKSGVATLALIGCLAAHAQAPIRERGEAVSPIDGARRAADRASDALASAENRRSAAQARIAKAEQALAAARKEQDAANIEHAAAESELIRARKSEAEAREALVRALDARK